MDLPSILSVVARIVKGINDYAMSAKDAPKSYESLKSELSSTHKILLELDGLVREGNGNVCHYPSSLS